MQCVSTESQPRVACPEVQVSLFEIMARATEIIADRLLLLFHAQESEASAQGDNVQQLAGESGSARAPSPDHAQASSHESFGRESRDHTIRSRERRQANTIAKADLQARYHLPISAAAKELDIGLTLLKKRCRELGVKRWPYRALKSMDKLLHSIESVDGNDPQVATAVDEIRSKKRNMLLAPSETPIDEETKRLRQAAYKNEFTAKRIMAAAAT